MKRKTWMLLAFAAVGVWLVMSSRRAAAVPVVVNAAKGVALDRAVNENSMIH